MTQISALFIEAICVPPPLGVAALDVSDAPSHQAKCTHLAHSAGVCVQPLQVQR